MVNYIGVRCPACNKKFISSDDIVVCPICGAPHHRDCYADNNACAFAADHLSGKEWNPPAPEPQRQPGGAAVSTCVRCGAANPGEYVFCQICGTMLSASRERQSSYNDRPVWANYGAAAKADSIPLVYGGLLPDEKICDESVRDIAQYIGESSAYYIPRFKAIADGVNAVTFNLAALVFNFLFFFHRKLYRIGIALLALYIISLIPQFFYAREMLPKIMELYGVSTSLVFNEAAAGHYLFVSRIADGIYLIVGFILAFRANRFYFEKTIGDIRHIRESCGSENQSRLDAELAAAGGTNRAAVFIIIGVLISIVFAVTSVIIYMGGGVV